MWAAVRDTDLVVLENARDLDMTAVASPRYDVGLAIIALGKAVVSRAAFTSSSPLAPSIAHHKPAVEYPLSIAVARSFAEKHRGLMQILKFCEQAPRSRWKTHVLGAEPSAPPSTARRVDSLADMCALIREQRRFARAGGIWAGPDSVGRLAKFGRA